ncbi:MAG TPA: transcriptional regulator GcvA [Magnetospirillum sp.]|nr:transcriptional regulator GcvA [Magnetospirillum sp.]
MAYRLPPLNTLRLFEAAGRHLSFKMAAEELNVTPSAVSHGIQTLEEWLGASLFARNNRSLTLTAAGVAYLPRVREALHLLASATEAVPGRRPSGRLSVSVAPTFGVRWLVPNLPKFKALHPDIEVSLDTSYRPVEFPRDGIDVGIRMGRGDWGDLYALRLTSESLVPVCSPALAAHIAAPSDLKGKTLLRVVNVSEDWESWAAQAGVDDIDFQGALCMDTYQMALEAAAQGLGVAIGRLPLVAADIASGRLVAVLGPPKPCETAHWLVAGRESLVRPEVAAFRNWIRAELKSQSAQGDKAP